MGKLRAFGNSLNAEAAIAFISNFLESEGAGHAPLGGDPVTDDEDLIG